MTLQTWHYENGCPDCGKNWAEHRGGYSASKCNKVIPDAPTKLQEAVEEVIRQKIEWGGIFVEDDIIHINQTAIATILNAVVKGELK